MKRSSIFFFIGLSLFFASCKGRFHSSKYYKDMGQENATNEGYHANEAKRLIEYKDQNKNSIENATEEVKKENNKNLTELNKPNAYNSKKSKKQKKKFSFYH